MNNWNMILKPILYNRVFFIFIYLLGVLCIYVTGEKSYTPYYIKLYAELFLDLYILCFILSFLPKKIRAFSHWVLSIILYIVAIIDIFCYIRFGTTFTPNILRLILETNANETSGFFNAYITYETFISPLSLILLIAIAHIILCLVKTPNTNWSPNLHKRFLIGLLSIICLFILILGGVSSVKNKPLLINTWRFNTISKIENYFGTEYYASRAQYIPIYRFAFSLHANSLAKKQIVRLLQTTQNSNIDSCHYTSPFIVLIIGESYNKHHSQLYGYLKPTTPKQYERYNNQELYVFRDAISPYNITSDVFKCTFSLNDITKQEEWCDKPLFPILFRKAGYHVTFISNEFVLKHHGSFADFSGGVFINDPMISELQFDQRNTALHSFDEDIINEYQTLRKYNKKHNLIIFSLMGQHVDYRDRYPKQHTYFTYKDYSRKDLSMKDLQIVVDYDNATRYNDYVIDKIIQLFEKENAVIIYMPDHGEECFDEIKVFGRQHHDNVSKEMAKNEFEIPFWIWCSNLYKESNPDIIHLINNSLSKRFVSDDLPNLLLHFGGIYCKDYQDEADIISPNYTTRRRLIRGKIDYDKLMQTEKD